MARDMGRPPKSRQPTIIIGAGISGLACARRLDDAGMPFLVVSENIGGRIRRSQDGAVNLGAYYVRVDYAHVRAFVRLGRRIDKLSTLRHVGDESYRLWDRRLMAHMPEAARFLRQLRVFRRRYERLKERCLTVSQAQAIRADPLLERLYRQPASAFVAEHRLEDLARWYLAPAMRGTTFCTLDRISAFTMLLGALPVIVPIYEFTLDVEALAGGFRHLMIEDSVTEITSGGDGYEIRTERHGSLTAAHVVVATPADVARRLLALPVIKTPVSAHMFQISGALRPRYQRADINLFSDTDPTLAIARQSDGHILFCSTDGSPEFERYLTSWRMVEHLHWKPAFHIDGTQLLDCEQRPNLYLIGDHNICGLEDSYITGLYAASRIIAHTRAYSSSSATRRVGSSPVTGASSTA